MDWENHWKNKRSDAAAFGLDNVTAYTPPPATDTSQTQAPAPKSNTGLFAALVLGGLFVGTIYGEQIMNSLSAPKKEETK